MEGRTQFGNNSANWPSGPETAAAAAIRYAICAAKSSQAVSIELCPTALVKQYVIKNKERLSSEITFDE